MSVSVCMSVSVYVSEKFLGNNRQSAACSAEIWEKHSKTKLPAAIKTNNSPLKISGGEDNRDDVYVIVLSRRNVGISVPMSIKSLKVLKSIVVVSV